MFRETVAEDGKMLDAFCHALESGKADEVENLFTKYLEKTISIRDTFVRKPTKENFYHGILLGILGFKKEMQGHGRILIYKKRDTSVSPRFI